MTQVDYYQMLGIARDSEPAEIRAAFVRLSRLHHPDLAGTLPWRLQEVQQAYRCLSDSGTRLAHDRLLATTERDHLVRQTAVQRRLRRYDGRHGRPASRPGRRRRWRMLLIAGSITAAVVQMSLHLLG